MAARSEAEVTSLLVYKSPARKGGVLYLMQNGCAGGADDALSKCFHVLLVPVRNPLWKDAMSLPQRPTFTCPVCFTNESVLVRPYRTNPFPAVKCFAGLSIRSCRRCSLSFAAPMPNEHELEQYYADVYRARGSSVRLEPSYDSWDGASVRARAQAEFVFKHTAEPRSWLDIGAGYGHLLQEAQSRGIRRTGAVEPDRRCREYLQAAGHVLYENVDAVIGIWDIISCSHVLEHLSTPRQFLERVVGLLSPNGYLFVEVPNDCRLDEAMSDTPHLLFFTKVSLLRVFLGSAIKVVSVMSCGRTDPLRGWHTMCSQITRCIARRILHRPPKWVDRLLHPHFAYYSDGDQGAWLRVIAKRV